MSCVSQISQQTQYILFDFLSGLQVVLLIVVKHSLGCCLFIYPMPVQHEDWDCWSALILIWYIKLTWRHSRDNPASPGSSCNNTGVTEVSSNCILSEQVQFLLGVKTSRHYGRKMKDNGVYLSFSVGWFFTVTRLMIMSSSSLSKEAISVPSDSLHNTARLAASRSVGEANS